MASIFSFKCSQCGKIHEGAPSFSFKAPDPYLQQNEAVRFAGNLEDDFCNYEDEDGMHYFIRVCLEVPIHGYTEPFLWGVWVSLSDNNYQRYMETYDSPDESDQYFGWLCNHLPYYPDTYALKTHVCLRAGGIRPYIVLEETDHPLSTDFHRGISVEKAQNIAETFMHY